MFTIKITKLKEVYSVALYAIEQVFTRTGERRTLANTVSYQHALELAADISQDLNKQNGGGYGI